MVIGFKNDKSAKDRLFIPAEVPILPLRGTVAYPDLVMPLIVGRERSIRLVDEAMNKDRMIGIITQKNPDIEDPGIDDLYTIGTIATIMKMVKMVDGSQRVVVQGLCRFKLVEFTEKEPHLTARVLPIFEEYQKDMEVDAMYINLKNLYKKAIEMAPYLSSELTQIATKIENPGNLADLIASTINIGVGEKQEILEKTRSEGETQEGHHTSEPGGRDPGTEQPNPVPCEGRYRQDPEGILPEGAAQGHPEGAWGDGRQAPGDG